MTASNTSLKYLVTSVVVFALADNVSQIQNYTNRNIFDRENSTDIFVSKVFLEKRRTVYLSRNLLYLYWRAKKCYRRGMQRRRWLTVLCFIPAFQRKPIC